MTSATPLAIGLNEDPYAYRPMQVPRHRETLQLVPVYGVIAKKHRKPTITSEEQQTEVTNLMNAFSEWHDWLITVWSASVLEKLQKGTWLPAVLKELESIDDEIKEDGLPQVSGAARGEARRILNDLRNHYIAPTIYPTRDGEIAIHFKSPVAPEAVLIELNNDGQGACFSHTNGKSRRARYDDSSELPDQFVRAQLEALKSALSQENAT